MMAGIPAIATAFRSIPEVIQDRINGLLVRPGDPEELLAAIRLLSSDRQLLEKLGRASLAHRSRLSAGDLALRILEPMGIAI